MLKHFVQTLEYFVSNAFEPSVTAWMSK